MVNPLRGYISQDHQNLIFLRGDDTSRNGIKVVSGVWGVVGSLIGSCVSVTIGGDTIRVEKESAEAFFERNADRFQGIIYDWMTVEEKLLRLVELKGSERAEYNLSGLPRGLFEEVAFGGEEGKKMVIGFVQHFLLLIDALERNGFQLPQLRDMIFQSKEKGYLQFDREDLFTQILEENKDRLSELTAAYGRPEIRKFCELLIHRVQEEDMETGTPKKGE
jgi:hypothetical protein